MYGGLTQMAQMQNPAGLAGIEFIEFAGPSPMVLEQLFVRCGFRKIGKHKKKAVDLYRQNRVNFIVNREPDSFAARFAKAHGASICATGFRAKDAQKAYQAAIVRGAKPIEAGHGADSHSFPAVYGIGGSAIYFVDRYGAKDSFYDHDFEFITQDRHPQGFQMEVIDHLTNNVPKGEMQKWCDFYEKIFGFHETRYFDIRGSQTGLISKVMHSPCGTFSIPINEPNGAKSQIQEYLDEYNGSGIQHLALLTPDLIGTVRSLKQSGLEFLDTPETYFDMIPERLPNVTEPVATLKDLKILVDGDDEGYLLQIFTKNLIGPIFFEMIQRKNHAGFGNGNFQALFDAIERDQKQRGYL
jgi:4-hydroxyphenylpyruvate dioxygenase